MLTISFFAAGFRTGTERFDVDGSLPAKVQVWIPANRAAQCYKVQKTSGVQLQ